MAVLADLSEEERYFYAILQDQSGIDQAEFSWTDETSPDFVFRCWDFQYPWYRTRAKMQIDQCVAEGTLVLTRRGYVPIESVDVGDEVWTHRNRWRKVTYTWDRGEQDVVRAKGFGHHGVTVTSDHKFLTQDGSFAPLSEGARWGMPVEVVGDGGVTDLRHDHQRAGLPIQDGHAWGLVRSIEPAGRARVYDLEVEEDHSFVIEGLTVSNCARAIGKSVGIQMRAWAFAFTNPGEEMLITAPEMIHLDPVTKNIEDRILSARLSREFLKKSGISNGIKHRPFEVSFRNNASIKGRIPQKDGKGVKGMHPKKLEMDEAQDYPEPGWVELGETLKYGDEDATWRAHGVSRGVRDRYYKQTQKESGWYVHRVTAMHRPDWSDQERKAKAELYGSRDHPDYRRNILGLHGDASSALFVLTRLMACVDQNQDSYFNLEEYHHVRINEEKLNDSRMPIEELLDFPSSHKQYARVWVGMDVGMTNHPSEILIFAEEYPQSKAGGAKAELPNMRLKCIARVHLERISSPDQRRVLEAIWDFYRPQAIAMDRTGLGLPIYQEIAESAPTAMVRAMRPYNFSEKIVIGYEEDREAEEFGWAESDLEDREIKANVLEYSSDMLRQYIDRKQILLPWDIDMIREFQGQTYVVSKSNTDAYGKKKFNQGKFHALDAARMAILGHLQEKISGMREIQTEEPVYDMFLI